MSFLGKLFGRRSAAEERAKADELFARGDHGRAKLTYEDALRANQPEDAALRSYCEERIIECCDAIARARVEEAERLFAQGADELALAELENAAEIARSQELVREVEARMDGATRKEARAHAVAAAQSEDERFELISGNWEAEQHAEYAGYGRALRSALLALHDGDATTAHPVLEELVAKAADDARYVWLELARARLGVDDRAGGRAAIEHFLAKLEPHEGGDARLVAYVELAALCHEQGDTEAAIAHHQTAIEALPDDPRPYLALGRFLRRAEMPEEGAEVLDAAMTMLADTEQPQLAVKIELGLCHADAGAAERAIELLEEVVTALTAQRLLDLPPELGTKLAQLHDKHGNAARAADLYAMLASGSDVANHYTYYGESGRLLASLGLRTEARRAYQSAIELAPDDAARAPLQAALAAL